MKNSTKPIFEYDDYLINEDGKVFNTKKDCWVTQHLRNGYLRVGLYKSGQRKWHSVHKLVLNTFKPTTDSSLQVNHIDGNKLNNSLINLEWCTLQENVAHAIKTGLSPNVYKLDEATLNTVLNEYLQGIPYKELVARYSCTSSLNTQLIKLSKKLGKYSQYTQRRKENAVIGGIKGKKITYLIKQLDVAGNLIATYDSIKQAATHTNISRPTIKYGCDTGNIAKGFLWKKELL